MSLKSIRGGIVAWSNNNVFQFYCLSGKKGRFLSLSFPGLSGYKNGCDTKLLENVTCI
jgi:hypothetical protein